MHTVPKIIARPHIISKYFNASMVVLLSAIYCAEFVFGWRNESAPRKGALVLCGRGAETAAAPKNSRNTCPKINSSASKATAIEKINPATTAMNVIAICITPPKNLRTAIAQPRPAQPESPHPVTRQRSSRFLHHAPLESAPDRPLATSDKAFPHPDCSSECIHANSRVQSIAAHSFHEFHIP